MFLIILTLIILALGYLVVSEEFYYGLPKIPHSLAAQIAKPIQNLLIPYPRFVGYYSGENFFCIDGQGIKQGCSGYSPYDLKGTGNSFKASYDYAMTKGSRFMALAKHDDNGGYLFTFDYLEGAPAYGPDKNTGCLNKATDDPTKTAGCADQGCQGCNPPPQYCPAGTDTRCWAVYKLRP